VTTGPSQVADIDACTPGNKSATRTPMMAITVKSSTSVKARRVDFRVHNLQVANGK
jgi:hypothetical protein